MWPIHSTMLTAPLRHCSGWIHQVPLPETLPLISPPPLLVNCITLHPTLHLFCYTALHYTVLYYIKCSCSSLDYTVLHYITLTIVHYITLYCTKLLQLQFTTLHHKNYNTPYCNSLHYTIIYYITLTVFHYTTSYCSTLLQM